MSPLDDLLFDAAPTPLQSPELEAGRQSRGFLWSTMDEVFSLLNIPSTASIRSDPFLFQNVQIKAGQPLHTIGQPFDTLYLVRSGFLKTALIDDVGEQQVLSFPMKGDLLGVDAIGSKRHQSESVALSDCEIILLPYKKLTALGLLHEGLEIAMFETLSREIARRGALINVLGVLNAEVRVARFLLSMGSRFEQMGYSGKRFYLRMTRRHIGSYLGLTQETVSRVMGSLAKTGLISISGKMVILDDIDGLRSLRSVKRHPNVRRPMPVQLALVKKV